MYMYGVRTMMYMYGMRTMIFKKDVTEYETQQTLLKCRVALPTYPVKCVEKLHNTFLLLIISTNKKYILLDNIRKRI